MQEQLRMLMAAIAAAAICAGCTGLEMPPVPAGERIPVNWDAGSGPGAVEPEAIPLPDVKSGEGA
jgi:hypothetical protein